jgi:hypothetical protein
METNTRAATPLDEVTYVGEDGQKHKRFTVRSLGNGFAWWDAGYVGVVDGFSYPLKYNGKFCSKAYSTRAEAWRELRSTVLDQYGRFQRVDTERPSTTKEAAWEELSLMSDDED